MVSGICRQLFMIYLQPIFLEIEGRTSVKFFLEEDKRATTNVQNGLVLFFYYLLLSFRLFELKQ